jgi:2-iminobutanoate/2-iminopropanoate deaminase
VDNAPAPKGAYSQVVRAGDFLYVSDQWPIDPETQSFVVSDIQDETKLTLDDVERVLQGCGASRKNIVKCGVFLAKAEDFAAMNEGVCRVFPRQCTCSYHGGSNACKARHEG